MLKVLTVAGLATFEIYAAIPAGFAFGLSPWTIFFASLVGGIAGIFVAAFLGDRIRIFFAKYRKPKNERPKTGLVHTIWNKYGLIGLGILGTFTVGAPISLAVGVGFNVPPSKLIPWCCIGVFARCAIFTTLGHFGMKML
ncbi:MAG: hypothetical protein ABIT07_05905 [Ferruginibacter sp.]